MKLIPKSKKALAVGIVVASIATAGIASAATSVQFKDTDGKWYKQAAQFAAEHGIMTGMGNGKFEGDQAFTRGMAAMVAQNMYTSIRQSFEKDFAQKSETDALKERVAQLEATNKAYDQAFNRLEQQIADLNKDAAPVATPTPTPAPSPTPAATTVMDGIVDYSDYQKITKNMTKAEVDKVVGVEGTRVPGYASKVEYKYGETTMTIDFISANYPNSPVYSKHIDTPIYTPNPLTQQMADQFKSGMSLQQVVNIIGSDGYEAATDFSEFDYHRWAHKNADGTISTMYATIDNRAGSIIKGKVSSLTFTN